MAQEPNQPKPSGVFMPSRVIPFMDYKWLLIAISAFLVVFSFYFIWAHGFNFGVDFKGGVKLLYQFQAPVGDEKIRGILEPLNLGDVQVVGFGRNEENRFMVKVKHLENRDIAKEITKALENALPKVQLLSEENVGPKVGAELRRRGVLAVILTWVFILIYIGWRFDFLFAPGAVVSLIHDTLISIGFFVFFHKEFNLPILAAVLTLLGYSMNDTVVVFDRIRENLKKLPTSYALVDIVNISFTETLSRTIVTSLTVLFVMAVLFFLGGGVLHDFAFFMLIGVVVGTYSSIFIASPVYLACAHLFPNQGLARRIGKKK